jgi:glutathione S-transferase
MTGPKLYGHPFSAYCQKAMIAFAERGFDFELRMLAFDDAAAGAEFAALWPIRRMPILVDGDRTLMEATIIVEHADLAAGDGARLVPADAREALDTRMMDRIFDNYVMTPMQKIVLDRLREADRRDAHGVAEARDLLERAYRWLDGALAGRTWAAGETFSLADCAAAPALFYADWAHPIDAALARLRAYRARLLARPSVRRAVDAARPYRPLFPGGAPDRD